MKKTIIGGLLSFVAIVLVACGGAASQNEGSQKTVKVGSKNFTESLIISEIYANALEDNGYTVERVQNIAGSIIPKSIESGEIDLYPEYTGTALLSIFKLPLETDPDAVFAAVKEAYEKAGVLTVLNYAPGNDGQGIAIKTSVAQKYQIATISDLQANAAKIRFASQGEFDERADGLKGLANVYGPFNFLSSTVYDNSLKYQVLTSDEADATPAYTTEGPLSDKTAFTVLVDDKQFWPPYNLMPVVRQDLLKAHPEIAEIINQIDQGIDTETLIQLNAKVDIEGEDYTKVAKAYYESLK